MKHTKNFFILMIIIFLSFTFNFSQAQDQYILLAWNDLGMHCANQDFSKMCVLPPYNNVFGQLILKSPNQLPQVVKNGYKIEYSIPFNTYSVGKTNFWTYAQQLFNLGQPLPANIGLTGIGLSGLLDTGSNYFKAVGIPNTPYTDTDLVHEKPFQTFHLVAKLINGTSQIAYTDNVIPVSNEIGCVQSGCHTSEQSIKDEHPDTNGFKRYEPELCARCHASNALGTQGDTIAKPFSYRIHEKHHDIQPINGIETCYKCHPGPNTQCFRDIMRAGNMICQNCHGTMIVIANSVLNGRRPWLDEPKCGNTVCHGSNYSEETGKLYRQSKGHGGLFCSACHGSPHAIYPSRELNDNLQSIRLQGHIGAISDCLVCHSSPPSGPGPHGIFFIGIRKNGNEVPSKFSLYQNFPNPFNPTTNIRFDLPQFGIVKLVIIDAIGREVAMLINEQLKPGKYEVKWDGTQYSSGIYFYRITINSDKLIAGEYTETRKLVLLK